MTPTDQNYIHEEFLIIWSAGDASYQSVQNILPSSLLSMNIMTKIYRTKISCFHVAKRWSNPITGLDSPEGSRRLGLILVIWWQWCSHVQVRGGRHIHVFLCNKTKYMHQFHKFILSWNSTCFGQFVYPVYLGYVIPVVYAKLISRKGAVCNTTKYI